MKNYSNKYKWLKFRHDRYSQVHDVNIEEFNVVNLDDLPLFESQDLLFFTQSYSTLEIPAFELNILHQLLNKYSFLNLKEQLITAGCIFQKRYSDNYSEKLDELDKDFDSTHEGYLELLEIIEGYLFSENKKNLKSISFKNENAPTNTIDNFFVLDDVYKSICKGLDIDKENFQIRKREILESTNRLKVSKYSEIIKKNFIQNMVAFLMAKSFNESQSLKFTGVFLKIFQVSPKQMFTYIELSSDLNENLKAVDVKNIKHYISRDKNYRYF